MIHFPRYVSIAVEVFLVKPKDQLVVLVTMGEELDEEQLLEFCQRLGLAEDGYLDEKDLLVVCNCIGLNAPPEVRRSEKTQFKNRF